MCLNLTGVPTTGEEDTSTQRAKHRTTGKMVLYEPRQAAGEADLAHAWPWTSRLQNRE